jgi:hypothetical protein
MNWTELLRDSSQALFTLIGVFLGATITFIINILNNRFQAKENDKDRIEKRRESKVQLTLELMKEDLKNIEDAINSLFEVLEKIKNISFKKSLGEISQGEYRRELILLITGENVSIEKFNIFSAKADVLVYTCGDEIYSTYKDCDKVFLEYLQFINDPTTIHDNDAEERMNDNLIRSYGKLQQMLREKLISIREIE